MTASLSQTSKVPCREPILSATALSTAITTFGGQQFSVINNVANDCVRSQTDLSLIQAATKESLVPHAQNLQNFRKKAFRAAQILGLYNNGIKHLTREPLSQETKITLSRLGPIFKHAETLIGEMETAKRTLQSSETTGKANARAFENSLNSVEDQFRRLSNSINPSTSYNPFSQLWADSKTDLAPYLRGEGDGKENQSPPKETFELTSWTATSNFQKVQESPFESVKGLGNDLTTGRVYENLDNIYSIEDPIFKVTLRNLNLLNTYLTTQIIEIENQSAEIARNSKPEQLVSKYVALAAKYEEEFNAKGQEAANQESLLASIQRMVNLFLTAEEYLTLPPISALDMDTLGAAHPKLREEVESALAVEKLQLSNIKEKRQQLETLSKEYFDAFSILQSNWHRYRYYIEKYLKQGKPAVVPLISKESVKLMGFTDAGIPKADYTKTVLKLTVNDESKTYRPLEFPKDTTEQGKNQWLKEVITRRETLGGACWFSDPSQKSTVVITSSEAEGASGSTDARGPSVLTSNQVTKDSSRVNSSVGAEGFSKAISSVFSSLRTSSNNGQVSEPIAVVAMDSSIPNPNEGEVEDGTLEGGEGLNHYTLEGAEEDAEAS